MECELKAPGRFGPRAKPAAGLTPHSERGERGSGVYWSMKEGQSGTHEREAAGYTAQTTSLVTS